MSWVFTTRPARRPTDFHLYFLGQSVSEAGSALSTVALPLIVLELTHSPLYLGLATAAAYIPWLVLGLVGGALMDQLDRKRTMILVDLLRMLVVGVLPLEAAASHLRMSWVMAVIVIQASLQVIFVAGTNSAVVALVRSDRLARANSLIATSETTALLLGTGVAGIMFSVCSPVTVMAVDALSFGASALSLSCIRSDFNPQRERFLSLRSSIRRIISDTRQGLAYLRGDKMLKGLSLQIAAVNLFGSMGTVQVAFLAERNLGSGQSGVGYLYAESAGGGLLASLVLMRFFRSEAMIPSLAAALSIYGVSMIVLGLISSYWVGLGIETLSGMAVVIYNVTNQTIKQKRTPEALMSRISSAGYMLAWCPIPLGSVVGGSLASAWGGPGPVFVLAGSAIGVIAACSYRRLSGFSSGTSVT